MKMQKISDHCYAVLNEANRVCDANSGLINLGGGVVIDTQSDLSHARQMIDLFSQVWTGMPQYVVLTHEDIDHVAGNQLFPAAEIIGHRSMPERMKFAADPSESQQIQHAVADPPTREVLSAAHPGLLAVGDQLVEDYDFGGIELVMPTTLYDDRHVLDLDGSEVHIIYVGPAHQVGDSIVHLPSEGVLFSGDVLFHECTPMGWVGSYDQFFSAIDTMIDLDPAVVVPGHGPVCGVDALRAEREYFQLVYDKARASFDAGLSAQAAAERLQLGRFGDWKAPSRLTLNVERAYREFRDEAPDAPWDKPAVFDSMYALATIRDLPVEY
jgi:cyclase